MENGFFLSNITREFDNELNGSEQCEFRSDVHYSWTDAHDLLVDFSDVLKHGKS